MRFLLVRLLPLFLRLAMDPALRQALPVIYARLDGELALWVQESLGAGAVRGRIAAAVGDALGHSPTPGQLALVRLLYDPVQAAGTAVLLRRSCP